MLVGQMCIVHIYREFRFTPLLCTMLGIGVVSTESESDSVITRIGCKHLKLTVQPKYRNESKRRSNMYQSNTPLITQKLIERRKS